MARGWLTSSASTCPCVSFQHPPHLSLVFYRTLVPQGNHWLHSDKACFCFFPTAAETTSSSREDLPWSPGCDRHMAVQGRLDVMEEVMRGREEGIMKLHGQPPGWRLCGVEMSGNPGRFWSPATKLNTSCSNWDVWPSNVLYPHLPEGIA